MTSIAGTLVVLGAVIGGFLMENGNPAVLVQPAEFVIILGSALGAFLIASPGKVALSIVRKLGASFRERPKTKEQYIELLSLMYRVFSKIRKEGLIAIETDVEDPGKSSLFSKFPAIVGDPDTLNFICDNLKVIVTTSVPPHELDSLLDIEIETHLHQTMIPSHSVARIADAMPGLGIVAAVLGVILTMGKIDQPPSVLGHSIGAALVGTFLGVLACYGFLAPLAANLEYKAKEAETYLKVIKLSIVSFVGGSAPQVAVEFGRRAIPGGEKPTFDELEKAIRREKR